MSGVRISGAAAVWTSTRLVEGVDVAIDGGRVTALSPRGAGTESNLPALDASGCIVIPGLVNAHHHLLQTAFRTLPGTRNASMSEWLRLMAAAYRTARVDPELAHLAALVGAAEGLLAGVTTVADHHLTWPDAVDPLELAEAAISGAVQVGGRLVFVRGTAGDDPEVAAASTAALAERFGALAPGGMLQLATGPAGVHSDGEATFRALGEVAAQYGLARRTQANEQIDVLRAAAEHGARPLELLDRWGWLARDVTIAHLCDITPAERELLAERGIAATHAPGCDVPMGWGVAEVGALLDANIIVGLGTSGGGSNDAGHVLADARLAMQVSPLTGRPLTALEVLGMATAGSAAGLGRPELGSLEPGCAGDLAVYDVSGPADAGVADPLAGLLWADPGRKPRHVVVGGEVVVEDWRLTTVDIAAVVERFRAVLSERFG